MERRTVIQFIAGVTAGVMVTPIPWKLTDDLSIWSQNWSWIPKNIKGESAFVPATSKLCPSACGIKVRVIDGRPVAVMGNPDNPLGATGVSPLAAAEVQLLYSPSRVKRPLKRQADGAYTAITWDEALALVTEKVGAVKGMSGKIAAVSGDETGSINEVLTGLLAAAGSSSFFVMPGEMQTASKAWNGIMGGQGQLGYDIEGSDFVLAVGADVLESWGTVVRNRNAFAKARPAAEKPQATYVYAGAVENGTATGADEFVAIKPGSEATFALGLAYYLLEEGASVDAPDFAAFKDLVLKKFGPKAVAKATGADAGVIAKVAKALRAASKPLVIVGSAFNQGGSPTNVIAGAAVNMLLGRLNKPGGMTVLPVTQPLVRGAMSRQDILKNDLVTFLADMEKGRTAIPEVLVVYDANPVYALPQAAAMAETLAKVPFKVSFSAFLDETALACDLVLPIPLGIERYDDVDTPYGCGKATYCANGPVIAPVFDSAPGGEVLMAVAANIGIDLGFSAFQALLEAKASAKGCELGAGVTSDEQITPWGVALGAAALTQALKAAKADEGLAVAPVCFLRMGSAKVAMSPFALKAIRDTELLGTDSFVQMNSATAGKQGLSEGDAITLTSAAGSIAARVHVAETVMDDVVAVPMGFGHSAYDEYVKGKGANVSKLLTARFEAGTGMPVWADATVTIAKA
ncbi:MAG: menaquinone reductase molybdopterin-binding-like subunit QrcB [Desulfovibrionaceae bacterium]